MNTSKDKTAALAGLAAIALLLAAAPAPAKAPGDEVRPPNILLILVDDVGYCDVGAFAERLRGTTTDRIFYETPRIDQLAAEGTMFTQFYACTVCAPSRASLLTGRMNNRMGMWDAYAAVKTTFEKNDLVASQPKRAHDMLVQLTDWLQANCNEAYLPAPNPKFDPKGPLPYGPYLPLGQLKAAFLRGR